MSIDVVDINRRDACALDRRQRLESRRLLVEPAGRGGRLHHRVLAGDVVGGHREARPVLGAPDRLDIFGEFALRLVEPSALFVEPERVRLFTDFRYIESAQAVEGVEAVQTKRTLIGWLAEELSGRVGFEANVLPWSFAEQLRGGGIDLVPRKGLVEQLRAIKDEGGIPTWLGAHAVPHEYDDADEYLDFALAEVLPEAAGIADADYVMNQHPGLTLALGSVPAAKTEGGASAASTPATPIIQNWQRMM